MPELTLPEIKAEIQACEGCLEACMDGINVLDQRRGPLSAFARDALHEFTTRAEELKSELRRLKSLAEEQEES
jgi:hypothetical protein